MRGPQQVQQPRQPNPRVVIQPLGRAPAPVVPAPRLQAPPRYQYDSDDSDDEYEYEQHRIAAARREVALQEEEADDRRRQEARQRLNEVRGLHWLLDARKSYRFST